MALTTINSDGVKDDSIVNADIKSDAAIALSKLASTPAVLTGSTDNTITTVTGANAIQGEANLTFDGTKLILGGTTLSSSNERPLQVQSTDGPKIAIGRNDTSITDGNTIGGLEFYGNDADGTFVNTAAIIVNADGTHGDNDKPTRMQFYTTADNGSSASERFRIESDGDFRFSSGDAGTNYGGIRGWNASTGDMIIDADKSSTGTSGSNIIFKTRGGERARIQHGGDVSIADGNLVVANGHGIDFSAQTGTSASGAATGNVPAEVLSCYEEGTWTPVANFASSGSVTVGGGGHFTRVGRIVTITWTFYTTSISSPSGSFSISGLPFACYDHSNARFGASFGFIREWNTDMPNLRGMITGGTTMYFYKQATNSDTSTQVQGSDFATGTSDNYIYGSATYMAA